LEKTADFLTEDGKWYRWQLFPVLMDAVLAALDGGPPVLVVTDTSDEAARWIAAVSHMLPPRLADKLGFSTGETAPGLAKALLRGGGLHIVGCRADVVKQFQLSGGHSTVIVLDTAGLRDERARFQDTVYGELRQTLHESAFGNVVVTRTLWHDLADLLIGLRPAELVAVLTSSDDVAVKLDKLAPPGQTVPFHWPLAVGLLTAAGERSDPGVATAERVLVEETPAFVRTLVERGDWPQVAKVLGVLAERSGPAAVLRGLAGEVGSQVEVGLRIDMVRRAINVLESNPRLVDPTDDEREATRVALRDLVSAAGLADLLRDEDNSRQVATVPLSPQACLWLRPAVMKGRKWELSSSGMGSESWLSESGAAWLLAGESVEDPTGAELATPDWTGPGDDLVVWHWLIQRCWDHYDDVTHRWHDRIWQRLGWRTSAALFVMGAAGNVRATDRACSMLRELFQGPDGVLGLTGLIRGRGVKGLPPDVLERVTRDKPDGPEWQGLVAAFNAVPRETLSETTALLLRMRQRPPDLRQPDSSVVKDNCRQWLRSYRKVIDGEQLDPSQIAQGKVAPDLLGTAQSCLIYLLLRGGLGYDQLDVDSADWVPQTVAARPLNYETAAGVFQRLDQLALSGQLVLSDERVLAGAVLVRAMAADSPDSGGDPGFSRILNALRLNGLEMRASERLAQCRYIETDGHEEQICWTMGQRRAKDTAWQSVEATYVVEILRLLLGIHDQSWNYDRSVENCVKRVMRELRGEASGAEDDNGIWASGEGQVEDSQVVDLMGVASEVEDSNVVGVSDGTRVEDFRSKDFQCDGSTDLDKKRQEQSKTWLERRKAYCTERKVQRANEKAQRAEEKARQARLKAEQTGLREI
jgi:hypothetical protein